MDDLFDLSMLVTERIPKIHTIIDDLSVYQHYAPLARLGTQKSPLRPEVNSPSFGLYERHGKISFKDHGEGLQGDVYDFVIEWYKVHMNKVYSTAEINKVIYYDMKLGNKDNRTVESQQLFFNDAEQGPTEMRGDRAERTKIQVMDIGWTSWALRYWIDRYNIAPAILDAYNVGHAKEVWVTPPGKKTYLWGVSTESNPIFYFYFPHSGHMKCYRPLEKNKKKKWIMNCDNTTDIQGYYPMQIKLTRPKLVIFTKAMKEVMFYRSFHIDALAIHGESHHYTPDFMRHIRKYSEHQLAVYDNDWPGMRSTVVFKKKYNVDAYFIKGAKNITDLWEKKPRQVETYIDLLKETYQL